MPVTISAASYGKAPVRVLHWAEEAGRHVVRDLSLSIAVTGDLDASYLHGDNGDVLPSDSLRRHALAELGQQPERGVEDSLVAVGRRILAHAPALSVVTLETQGRAWRRLGDHSFVAEGQCEGTRAVVSREAEPTFEGSLRGATLMMTTGSRFTGFLHDELTTQRETQDRPLVGTLDADWGWAPGAADADTHCLAEALLALWADRRSNAIQQLLTETAQAALASYRRLAWLRLSFAALPSSPIPSELAGVGHEVGTGPVGLSEVTVSQQA